jgi:DNA-binding response OmpR family regulator
MPGTRRLASQPMVTVLLVEDNDALRESTMQFLAKNGVAAWGVSCAEEVAEFSKVASPQVYLIDIGLPGEDGLSLAARLREAHPSAGIVMLTARDAIADRVAGYGHGADVYMPKPVDPEELLAVVRALSQRVSGLSADADALMLKLGELALVGPGGQQALTQREATLLAAFARAPERTLERWQILEILDPANQGVSPESMEVCIGQVRKKIVNCLANEELSIGSASAPQAIKAIRGVGYRLLLRINAK